MNKEDKKNTESIKDKILHDIRSGEISMRPKIYFTLKVAALAVVTLLILAVSVFMFNFILFTVHINSQDTLLDFGPRGFQAFLAFFPWPLLVFDVLLVVLLEWMIRRFKFGYKIPVLYLLAGLLALTVILGVALDSTSFNRHLMKGSRHLPPPLRDAYQGAHRQMPRGSGVCKCVVLAIDGNILTVQDTRSGTSTLTVILPLGNPQATSTALQPGDEILIAGEEKDGVIQAFGIRKIELGPDGFPIKPPRPRK